MLNECKHVFVYGTLKQGYGNNRLLLSSEFIGATKTVDLFYMDDLGCPMVFPSADEDALPVWGEVYKVTDELVARSLDRLEGWPHIYDRKVIRTELGLDAWVYYGHNHGWGNSRNRGNVHEGAWLWD